MLGLEYFSFRELWSPVLLFIMMLIGVLYTFIVGPWSSYVKTSTRVPMERQIAFLIAIALLYLVLGGPLSLLGHLLFTFHMVNMAIMYFVVPSLLIYGIPEWLWKWAFQKAFWKLFRPLTSPLIGLFLFNLLFSFYHLPSIHDWFMTHYKVNIAFYLLMLAAALMNWWHIQCPVPEWARLTPLRRIGYIFANGLILTPACVLIIFAQEPLFLVYSDPNEWAKAMQYCIAGNPDEIISRYQGGAAFFNIMSVRTDQQLGGIVMKLFQEFVNIIALYLVFMRWYRLEKAKENDFEIVDVSGDV